MNIDSQKNTSELPCYHCGAECGKGVRFLDSKPFCCEGCKTVFQILEDKGLEEYYEMNVFPGTKVTHSRYAFLDHEGISEKLLDFQEGGHSRISVKIPAIHCTSCIWLLEHLYQLEEGVLRSEVNFPKREAYIHFDDTQITLRELAELLDRIGYPPNLSLENLEGKKTPEINQRILLQLGVAGFCFGNIMLLSFPEYIGLEESSFAQFFGYLNILLSLPVLLFSAIDYFKSAINGLRQSFINMDVPISLGIATLFIRSCYDILSGTDAGYLDSMAGLIFFLLIGKLYQNKTYSLLSFERDYKSYFPIAITRVREEDEEDVPLSEISMGDRLLIRNGELVPADAILMEGDALLDYSFVTGESDLVPKRSGDLLYAGGRQSGGAIKVETVSEVSQSYLTQLWNNDSFGKKAQSDITQLSNRVSHVFTLTVLVIALIAGISWYFIDPSKIIFIVSAVLIVACPCALALSTPFTLGNTLRILGKNGLFLKSPWVIERLSKTSSIVFDKTGTITQAENVPPQYEGTPLNVKDKARIRSLLKHSTHPLSRQLFNALDGDSMLPVNEFKEITGKGITGLVNQKTLKIGSPSFLDVPTSVNNQAQIHISQDNHYLGSFFLPSIYRPGLKEMLTTLSDQYKMTVLTGDTTREKENLTAHFPEATLFKFNQSPMDKMNFILALKENQETVLMVGDGLNDAGALQQSDVGISVAEDIAAFTPASDGILSADTFSHLPTFLRYSQSAMKVIKASFGLSLLYNIIGLTFAITGNLSPLVAAILMPASSVSVVLFTTLLTNYLAWKQNL